MDELLAEIGLAPLITCEEERLLLKAVKEKGADSDEVKQLEQANIRFKVSLVVQYQHRGMSLEELIEAGKSRLSQLQPRAMNKLLVSKNKSLYFSDLFFDFVELEVLAIDVT